MRVLVLNSGSSSLKFRIIDVADLKNGEAARAVLGGSVTSIGGKASLKIEDGGVVRESGRPIRNHEEAVRWVFQHLERTQVDAVGHRVVHGGDRFREPVQIDEAVAAEIERVSELAPLHNPPGLATIRGARAFFGPRMPMVAVFDTAFHAGMPAVASMYAISEELSVRHRIRRYGFHGIAHASMAAGYAALTGKSLNVTRLITLHLGNGCSATAIRGGRSVETSMGFTPLEGLVMGTRSGDLDPAVVSALVRKERVDVQTVEQWLNERSGLLGVSGLSNDVRTLLEAEQKHDARAALALDLFCYRARKYIGAYLAVLGGADAVVFGGGIGEHAPSIRARICEGMEWCGLILSPERNEQAVGLSAGQGAWISSDVAGLAAAVVAVDEETWIAQETTRCLSRARHAPEADHGPR